MKTPSPRALLLLGLAACSAPANPPKPDAGNRAGPSSRKDLAFTQEENAPSVLPTATVVLRGAFGGTHRVLVEVAADGVSRAQGLMWRRALDEGKGMLFVFPSEALQSFWMKNTLIPLDMIFIGEDRRVKGIVERAQPMTFDARSVSRPSRYVLEVPGGFSEKAGLTVDSLVEFEGVSRIPVRP